MFERILVPLDGSPLAEAILPKIRLILRRQDSEILLLRVAEPPAASYSIYGEVVPMLPMSEDYRQEAKSYIRRVEERLIEDGARARGMIEPAPVAGAILQAAEKEKATLIAMATHGRTGLARWVFGSVAEKVLRASSVPLLILRSFEGNGTPTPGDPLLFKNVLVPISAFHLRIVPYVREFALLFGSRILLLHVNEPLEDEAAARKALDEMNLVVADLKQAGIDAEIRERKGDPAHEILKASREEQAGLMAITTHGRKGPDRWALGSVTEKVLRGATVPMLIIRQEKPA